MSIVKIKDKTFQTSIPEAEIKQRVKELAAESVRTWKARIPYCLVC